MVRHAQAEVPCSGAELHPSIQAITTPQHQSEGQLCHANRYETSPSSFECAGDRGSTIILDERPMLDVHMLVLTAVRKLLGADVAADMPLAQAGLDSLGALELRDQLNRLFSACWQFTRPDKCRQGNMFLFTTRCSWPRVCMGRSLGIQLPGAAAFDFPTAAALAACCIAQLGCASVPDACLQPSLKPRDAPARCRWKSTHLSDCTVAAPRLITSQESVYYFRTQLMSIDGSVQRFPAERAHGSATKFDTVTPTPLERWDLDASHVSQRAGTRFGR